MRNRVLFAAAALLSVALLAACSRPPRDTTAEMFRAAEQGDIRIISRLLQSGVSVNVRDAYERTPLMIASLGGHKTAVRTLLEANADVDAVGKFGGTALAFATREARTEIVEMLVAAGATR